MPNYSRYNPNYEFDENSWVITEINIASGLKGILGGHAKIIVEGLNNDPQWLRDHENNPLFVAEYHITEAPHDENIDPIQAVQESQNTRLPQWCRNSKFKYVVQINEKGEYEYSQEQCQKTPSISWKGVSSTNAKKMIQDIKDELFLRGKYSPHDEQYHLDHPEEKPYDPKFQYMGKGVVYSNEEAHNCATWVREKLKIAGIDNRTVITKVASSSSNPPGLDINLNPYRNRCTLL